MTLFAVVVVVVVVVVLFPIFCFVQTLRFKRTRVSACVAGCLLELVSMPSYTHLIKSGMQLAKKSWSCKNSWHTSRAPLSAVHKRTTDTHTHKHTHTHIQQLYPDHGQEKEASKRGFLSCLGISLWCIQSNIGSCRYCQWNMSCWCLCSLDQQVRESVERKTIVTKIIYHSKYNFQIFYQ